MAGPVIIELPRIKELVKGIDTVRAIEEGFVAYSQGKVIVPPVGEMHFEDPPGEVHIKYGAIVPDDYYVIKLASGFAENPSKHGIPRLQGMMLMFNQKTGQAVAILLDQGYLTNVRTAAAGAVVAKYLAPKKVHRIGVLGVGMQGHMQVEFLKGVVDCNDVIAWAPSSNGTDKYRADLEAQGFKVETTQDVNKVAATCNLIITSTPSRKPLLDVDQIRPGTHITAMGSDTPPKIELDPGIVEKADIVVADSIPQSKLRGEISQAVRAGVFNDETVVELGNVIMNPELRRQSDAQITIADLTGVAVQDIQISKAVYHAAT